MTRFWKIDDHTTGTSLDDVDMTDLVDGIEEIDQAEYDARLVDAPKSPPVVTDLIGNGLEHTTDPDAKKVIITVSAPNGGPKRARPLIDGASVVAGVYEYDVPGVAIVVETKAGNNDVLIREVF